MAKETSQEKQPEKQEKPKPKALLKVYLVNGTHYDIEVPATLDPREEAEGLGKTGVWTVDRGEAFYYPPSQIFRIRVKYLS